MLYIAFPSLLVLLGWLWVVSLVIGGLLGADVRRHHFESAGLAFGLALVAYALVALRGSGTPLLQYHGRPMRQLSTWAPALLAVGAFGWTFGLGPLSDDYVLADWAQRGDLLPAQWPYVRPLPLALWRVIFSVGGSWGALHALNVALHACNAMAVGLLARRRLGVMGGVVAGTVFAVFPAGMEAVAWNASIFDLLATTFVLIAILLAPSASASAASAAGLAAACAGGVLSKETAVAIPALIALDAFLSSSGARDIKRLAVPLTISIVVIGAGLGARTLLTTSMSSHLDNLPDGRREVKDLITRPYAALAVPFRTEHGMDAEHYVAAGVHYFCFWELRRMSSAMVGTTHSGHGAGRRKACCLGSGGQPWRVGRSSCSSMSRQRSKAAGTRICQRSGSPSQWRLRSGGRLRLAAAPNWWPDSPWR